MEAELFGGNSDVVEFGLRTPELDEAELFGGDSDVVECTDLAVYDPSAFQLALLPRFKALPRHSAREPLRAALGGDHRRIKPNGALTQLQMGAVLYQHSMRHASAQVQALSLHDCDDLVAMVHAMMLNGLLMGRLVRMGSFLTLTPPSSTNMATWWENRPARVQPESAHPPSDGGCSSHHMTEQFDDAASVLNGFVPVVNAMDRLRSRPFSLVKAKVSQAFGMRLFRRRTFNLRKVFAQQHVKRVQKLSRARRAASSAASSSRPSASR
jgi:hypothetical protein